MGKHLRKRHRNSSESEEHSKSFHLEDKTKPTAAATVQNALIARPINWQIKNNAM
jgi:hypothetical protein